MSFVTVARLGELTPGDPRAVEIDGREIIVYRDGDGVFAMQRRCLHQGGDLAEGLVSRGFVICPVHGWKWHARTGLHEVSPETCLVTYAVRIQGDEVQIDPTPRRACAPAIIPPRS
jgi:nitrite reductase/ring-hydroxylating ferredoxin subunit